MKELTGTSVIAQYGPPYNQGTGSVQYIGPISLQKAAGVTIPIDKAEQLNLLGSQWGMMNETGNYPGQAWLWLYTFWYQIPPYNTSPNADALV